MIGRRLTLAVIALGVLGSQAGHLIAYQLRFGAAAGQLQSSGPHVYFPTVVKSSLGALAISLLAVLLMIGLARMLGARRAASGSSGPSYVGLLASLFTIQLACFVGQEAVEAQLAGAPAGTVAHLLLWGTLGQLPVAAVAALALRWLAARFEDAVQDLRVVLAVERPEPAVVPVLIPVQSPADQARLMSLIAGPSLAQRGPPSFSRISTH
jgi:hypothetical protein